MNSLTKREKRLLVILLSLIICVLYYNYIAEPLVEKLKAADAKLDSSKGVLASLKKWESNMGEIREQAAFLDKEAEKAGLSIPDDAKVPELVTFLEYITGLSGCKVQNLTLGQSSSLNGSSQRGVDGNGDGTETFPENLMVQPLTYEITGDLEGIMSLLDRIEKSDRKIVVDRISIVKNKEKNNLNANLSMSCFYLKQESISAENDYAFSGGTNGKRNIFD